MSKSHLKSFLLISFKPKFLDYLPHSGCFSLLKPPEQDEIMFEQLLLTNSWLLQHLGVQTKRFYARWLQTWGQLTHWETWSLLFLPWTAADVMRSVLLKVIFLHVQQQKRKSGKAATDESALVRERVVHVRERRLTEDSSEWRQILEGKGYLSQIWRVSMKCSALQDCHD